MIGISLMRESNDHRIHKISVLISAAFLDFHQVDLLPPAAGSDEWTLTVGSTDYIGRPDYAIGGETGARAFPSRTSKLSVSRVEPLLHAIAGLVIPACPPFALGFDGDTFTLKLDCGLNHAEYNWWCDVPEAWKPLGMIVDEIITLAEEPDWPRCRPGGELPEDEPGRRPKLGP